jgi:hypothetical protein
LDIVLKNTKCVTELVRVFGRGASDRLATDLAPQRVTLEIVKRTDKEGGFKLIRRRWVVERTIEGEDENLYVIEVAH